MQYDRRPDELFGVWFGTWNLGGLSGKGGKVCDELRKGMIDECCLQEVSTGCWGWREGDKGCVGLEKEMKLVVWKLW